MTLGYSTYHKGPVNSQLSFFYPLNRLHTQGVNKKKKTGKKGLHKKITIAAKKNSCVAVVGREKARAYIGFAQILPIGQFLLITFKRQTANGTVTRN